MSRPALTKLLTSDNGLVHLTSAACWLLT